MQWLQLECGEKFKAMLSLSAALTNPAAIASGVVKAENARFLYREGLMDQNNARLKFQGGFKAFFTAFDALFSSREVFGLTVERLLSKLQMFGIAFCSRGFDLFDMWFDVSSKNNRAYLYFGGKYGAVFVNALLYAEGIDDAVVRNAQSVSGALGKALQECRPFVSAPEKSLSKMRKSSTRDSI